VLVDIEWNETNRQFPFVAELVDSDMQPVMIQTGLGEQPIRLDGEIEAGRPPEQPPGTPIRIALAASFGSMVLTPGARYEWRITINKHEEDWSEGFNVRAR
jgi:hypothetical protein